MSRLPVVHSVAPQFLNFMISRFLGSSICEIVSLQASNLLLPPHTAQPYPSQTLPLQHPSIPPPPHPGVDICNLTTTSQPNQRVFRRMATSTSGKQVGKQVSRLPVVHSVAPQFLNFMISRVLGSSICEIVCLQVSNLFLLHILHSTIHQSFTHFLTQGSASWT